MTDQQLIELQAKSAATFSAKVLADSVNPDELPVMPDPALDGVWALVYFGRYEVHCSGAVRNRKTQQVLRPRFSSNGYRTVGLYTGESPSRPKSFQVHRLIMEGFYGPSSLQVNHKDGDTSNNSLTNLEYVTQSQNMRHAVDVLGRHVGENNHNVRLTDKQVLDIRSSGLTGVELARIYSVSNQTISKIRTGKRRVSFDPQGQRSKQHD